MRSVVTCFLIGFGASEALLYELDEEKLLFERTGSIFRGALMPVLLGRNGLRSNKSILLKTTGGTGI